MTKLQAKALLNLSLSAAGLVRYGSGGNDNE
jgi:hypothetical protein